MRLLLFEGLGISHSRAFPSTRQFNLMFYKGKFIKAKWKFMYYTLCSIVICKVSFRLQTCNLK